MKKRRHAKLLEIIKDNNVETQEDLQKLLREAGFDVTQATISRDIKELRLVKELSEQGRHIYSSGLKSSSDDLSARTNGIFAESIINVDYSGNMVCIKCFSGMAGAACAAIDSMKWIGVMGTIAGDDTIFVLCRNEKSAQIFTVNLENTINVKNS